jgi:hypothetical protein
MSDLYLKKQGKYWQSYINIVTFKSCACAQHTHVWPCHMIGFSYVSSTVKFETDIFKNMANIVISIST